MKIMDEYCAYDIAKKPLIACASYLARLKISSLLHMIMAATAGIAILRPKLKSFRMSALR